MNIKQALKEKNQLIKELSELMQRIHQYNSVDVEGSRPYSPSKMIEEYSKKVDKLVDLKTKIHLANGPIYNKIFRLSELKNMVSKVKNLDCTDGPSNDYYDRRSDSTIYKICEIDVVSRDTMVKKLEDEIQKIQDDLDEHNYKTKI